PWYRAADIFVFASHAEGFGNVLLEAMAYSLPPVSRRLAGVTDSFIADGETGLLFDTDAEFRAAVLRLAADPALRATIGAAAAAMVRAEYDLRAIAHRYAALYGA
ncbi:MAG: glycosyltransferase family 4 protein, partial [Acetobacteraceae bacterium]